MTSEEHNRYISWVFLAHAGFQILMMVLMLAIFSMFFFIEPGRPGGPPPPPKALFGVLMAFMSVIYLVFTLPSLIAAYALRKKKSWARMASIVAGVMSAMHVPIGTAACVYSLWFFLGENWKEIYPVNAASTPRQQLPEFDPAKWQGGFETDEQGRAVFQHAEPPDWR